MSRIFTDFVMHNCRSNQSAFMTRCGTDLRHQYGIFGGKSQTSFSQNATQAGSEEGWLFLQATQREVLNFDISGSTRRKRALEMGKCSVV